MQPSVAFAQAGRPSSSSSPSAVSSMRAPPRAVASIVSVSVLTAATGKATSWGVRTPSASGCRTVWPAARHVTSTTRRFCR